jgi:EmrB/QacA subfamily drug resistance transporter
MVLCILCLVQFMLAVDIVIVTVANPSIQHSLHITPEQLQWTVTAYSLTFGGFLLLGGRLSDHFGRRRMFLVGIAGFTIASVGAASATGPVMLIAFRALEGFFAAVTSPTTLALLAVSFAEGPERRRAYGLWATAASLGSVLGYLLGGVLTSLGWRWIFLINVPIGAIVVLGAVWFIAVPPSQKARQPLDLRGAVSVTAGLTLIIYGLGEAQSSGWGSPRAVASFVLGFLLLLTFALTEVRVVNPLLPLRLLPRRESRGLAVVGVMALTITATVFLLSLYMQQVLGYSALRMGVASLPIPIGVTLGAQVTARKLLRRFGARSVSTVGLAIMTCSFGMLARLSLHSGYWSGLMPAQFLLGVGLAMANVSLINTVTSGVSNEDQGIVAGLFNAASQMGAALGVAILVTVSTSVATGTSGVPPHPEAVGITTSFAIAGALSVVATLGAGLFLRSTGEKQTAAVADDQPVEVADVGGGLGTYDLGLVAEVDLYPTTATDLEAGQ